MGAAMSSPLPSEYNLPPPPAHVLMGGPLGAPQAPIDNRTARDHLDRIFTLGKRSWRFRWYAALVVLLGAVASLAAAMLRERQYTSETLIVYREGMGMRTISGSEVVVDAQAKLALKLRELVLSRTTLEKLIREYHLYADIMEKRGPVDAVDEMRKNIAFRAKDGETFGLSFTGTEPYRVQELTARLAREMLEENSKSRLESAGETKEFLDSEKQRSDGDLRDKEGALATFISKHPEFAREANGANSGTETGIAVRAMQGAKDAAHSSDPQLNALEREATRIQQRLGMPTKHGKTDAPVDPKLAAMRAEAEAEVKQAQRDVAQMLSTYTEEHPDVRAAKSRLKNAETKLKHTLESISASDAEAKATTPPEDTGEIDRAALEQELKKAQDAISAYKRKKASSPDSTPSVPAANGVVQLETDWTRLNREVTDARERNQQLEARQFKASILESAVTSGRNAQMIIVDPAYKPTHPNKGRTQIVGAGLAVSFVLALLVALALTLLDDRIYDRVDLDGLQLTPILGVVPKPDGKRDHRG
jgi:uncharacterized protein involved in exopolysaccharide biosynthesis